MAAVAFVVLLAMMATGVGTYLPARNNFDRTSDFGDSTNPDRVDVTVWINRVDAEAQTLSVSVSDISPTGYLADDNGHFRDNVRFDSPTSLTNISTSIAKGSYVPDIEHRYGLTGAVTDYPFDKYTADLLIDITGADGVELPVTATVFSTDPFFHITTTEAADASGGLDLTVTLRRSTPTMVYAVFVMVLMLGLAIAAATAAYYVLKHRKGLVFPACSMMAAMLFALVPLRNAVPGSPPIGSIIDFASFFVAEVVISVSLIAAVTLGYLVQLGHDHVAKS